jgi:thioredoxin 1
MNNWTDGLSPLARERLNRIGNPDDAERRLAHDIERLDALLLVYFKNLIDGNEVFSRLKEFEEQGNQPVLREARRKLEQSFLFASLPFKFIEGREGTVSVAMLTDKDKKPKEEKMVLELTGQTFDEAVKNNPSLVVDCWAPWCGPCRMMSPVIDELAEGYKGKVTFAKVNTDENQDIATRYQVMAIPTLLFFKDGKLADRKVGALPKKTLEAELTRTFNN